MKTFKYILLVAAVVSTLLALLTGPPGLHLQLKGDERDIEYFLAWLNLVSIVTACMSWPLFFTRLCADIDLEDQRLDKYRKVSTPRFMAGCVLMAVLYVGVITYLWHDMLRP